MEKKEFDKAVDTARELAGIVFKEFNCITSITVCIEKTEVGNAEATIKKIGDGVPVLQSNIGFLAV